MSRRSLQHLSNITAALSCLIVVSPGLAQDQPQNPSKPDLTAEQVLQKAETAYGPPPPKPKCGPQTGDEIVVCAEEEEQSQFRVQSSSQLDPESEEALDDGLPRAPDFGESCKKNPEKGPCIGFGYAPPPALIIDFSKLPEAPAGSDADRVGKGLAPRGNDGNSVGIAYNANLIGIRAVNDVVIDGSNDKDGVKDALVYAGDREDVKVISMSVGSPLSSGTVEDGVYYAYNKDKMICAAAGTSLNITTNVVNVIFPANMSQTLAITGVKDKFPLERCSTCHDGSQVEFAMPVEKVGDSENGPITLSSYSDTPNYSGGSSPSVSSVAGIAALVWGVNPELSRANIYKIMKESSSNFPNKDNNLGWGIIDAEAAVQVVIDYANDGDHF